MNRSANDLKQSININYVLCTPLIIVTDFSGILFYLSLKMYISLEKKKLWRKFLTEGQK